jgi:hypothetical protein
VRLFDQRLQGFFLVEEFHEVVWLEQAAARKTDESRGVAAASATD